MTNEYKLLNYKDVWEDDRVLTVICDDTGHIKVWYPNIQVWNGDETEEEIAIKEKADEELTDDICGPAGEGLTIEEALADYIRQINHKTLCFKSSYNGKLYLVTFDFENKCNFVNDNETYDF